MRIFVRRIYLYAFLFFLPGCSTYYQTSAVQYVNYKIEKGRQDSVLVKLVQPYSDSVHVQMNKVIAVAGITLDRKQPEGTLGNLVADAILIEGKKKFNTHIDASVMNIGGIRLNTLAAGDITLGKIFEIAPFDNTLVILDVPSNILQELADHISSLGGWPVSGLSWQISNKKAIDLKIQDKPIEPGKVYKILTNDYVANGGDYCEMLRPLPVKTNGYLLRDALIKYLIDLNKAGKKITASIENRIVNAN